MNKTMVMVAALHLAAAGVSARDVQVEASLRSPRASFHFQKRVTGEEASRLAHATERDLKPYVLAARKALAEREGFSEKIYGPDHYKLIPGVKVRDLSAVDARTGVQLYPGH